MMRRGLHIPLGIIPSGTANDFATYLGFKSGEVEDVCRTIVSTKPVDIDLGLVNDSIFFINVCAGGFFTNVSQIVDKDVKNALGSLSYYLKGVEQLPQFRKVPFRITTSEGVIEEDLYFYMIMNSAGTGGFTNLSPEASITDGKFEFIAIKGKPLIEMTPVLMKMLTGEHIHDKNVLYLRDHYFKIECLDPDFKIMESTVDGELGPDMPFEIKVIPKAIPVFGDLIDSSTNKLLNDFQQKKGQELLDVILQDDHSITSEMVNDVEFIINFARAKEAVQRLATTDKVEYFGNLIRNGYLQGKHIEGSIFDEYIHILNTMSYREIQYLVEYKKYCEDSSKRGKSTKHINGRTYSNKYESFCNEYSKQIKVSPGEVDYVFLHIKQTGFIEEEFETESGDVDENDNTFDSLDVESKGYYITKEFLDFYEMVLKRNENNG
jgi:YegS/Rv2252/BmrU family lipid kinase